MKRACQVMTTSLLGNCRVIHAHVDVFPVAVARQYSLRVITKNETTKMKMNARNGRFRDEPV